MSKKSFSQAFFLSFGEIAISIVASLIIFLTLLETWPLTIFFSVRRRLGCVAGVCVKFSPIQRRRIISIYSNVNFRCLGDSRTNRTMYGNSRELWGCNCFSQVLCYKRKTEIAPNCSWEQFSMLSSHAFTSQPQAIASLVLILSNIARCHLPPVKEQIIKNDLTNSFVIKSNFLLVLVLTTVDN